MGFSSSTSGLCNRNPLYGWKGRQPRSGGNPVVAGFRENNVKATPLPVRSRRSGLHQYRSGLRCAAYANGQAIPVSFRHGGKGRNRRCRIRAELGKPVEETGVFGGPAERVGVAPGGNGTTSKEDLSPRSLELDNGEGGGDCFDGEDRNGKSPPGGGGCGGGGGGGGDGAQEDGKEEGDEFGPVLKFEEVMKVAEARGTTLPSDMYKAAEAAGIRQLFLENYLNLQEAAWPLGALIKICPWLRDRMLADPQFLFKVGTEILIDSCCATFAEVQKRGKNFWSEFELYAADLLVGIVVDIALVGMLAPYARIGKPSVSKGFLGGMARVCGALPSSVFEAERPGCKFSIPQRIGTYFYKGVLYGSVGFACGLLGQGIANFIMNIKRSVKKSEEDIPVPPLIKSAALWAYYLHPAYHYALELSYDDDLMAAFTRVIERFSRSPLDAVDAIDQMKSFREGVGSFAEPSAVAGRDRIEGGVFLAVSSNTRYQIINGLERIVESSPVAKRVPPIAMGFTVGVRFANNIYGGMQFVDWAKWSGVQ